jgi:7-cyano-7-deazaguanine reductase
MYFWSFRDKGAFHEAITNEIFNHLVNTLGPRALKIQVKWFVRGGIYTTIEVENIKKSWSPIDSRILNKI